MLIDCSYFAKAPRQVCNATLTDIPAAGGIPTPGSLAVTEYIEAYISAYQEEFLRLMLGDAAGNRANAYLVCLDEDEESKHNDAYDAVCSRLRESFADYVFFHIVRDSSQQATMTGLVRLKSANEYVSPIQTQVSIWNTMVGRNRRFAEWTRSDECPLKGLEVDAEMTTLINRFNL